MRKSNIIDYKNPSQNLVTDVLSEFLTHLTQRHYFYANLSVHS